MPPRNRTDGKDVVFATSAEDPTGVLPAFPEHAKAIGCLIAEYSTIEHQLATFVAAMLGNRKGVAMPMIYAIESSRGRFEAMRAAMVTVVAAVLPHRGAGGDPLNRLVDETAKLLTQRNKYAHALFGRNTKTGSLMKIDPATYELTEVPLHDLEHQLQRMKRHARMMAEILAPVYEKMKEPRKASPPPDGEQRNEPDSDAAHTRQRPPKPQKPSRG